MHNYSNYTKKGIAALKFSDVLIVAVIIFGVALITATYGFLHRPDDPDTYRVNLDLSPLMLDVTEGDQLLVNGKPITLGDLKPLLTQARDQHRAVIRHERMLAGPESKKKSELSGLLTELRITTQIQFDPVSRTPVSGDH